MPLAFTTQIARVPYLRLHATHAPVPAWQLLRQEADRLLPVLRLVWHALCEDARRAVDTPALREALARSSLLDAEQLVMTAWQQAVDLPARQALLVLLREALQRSAVAVLPDTTAVLRPQAALQPLADDPMTGVILGTYVGTQLQGIQQTTRRAVRAVLREGLAGESGIASMARTVRTFLGLTPRQVMSIQGLRQRLQERGTSKEQIQREVMQAASLALIRRVDVIAQTQAFATVNAGAHDLWRQADVQGLWDAGLVRRVWRVAFDERACPVCRAIPGLNRGGVGLYAPFIIPGGTILHPPAHAACRCAVHLRRGPFRIV